MILFNTTFLVSPRADEAFHAWVRDEFIPTALAGNILRDPLFTRVLVENPDGTSYAIQFKADTMEAARSWEDSKGQRLKAKLFGRHGHDILPFVTYMDIL